MAFLVLVIDSNDDDIAQLNSKALSRASANPHEGATRARNYLDRILAGTTSASIEVTSRDSDPSVSTSGAGSKQETYNLK